MSKARNVIKVVWIAYAGWALAASVFLAFWVVVLFAAQNGIALLPTGGLNGASAFDGPRPLPWSNGHAARLFLMGVGMGTGPFLSILAATNTTLPNKRPVLWITVPMTICVGFYLPTAYDALALRYS